MSALFLNSFMSVLIPFAFTDRPTLVQVSDDTSFVFNGVCVGYCEIYKSSKGKMAGTCKENGSGSNAKKDDGRKTVHRKKKRKTSLEMDGWMMM